MDIGPLYASVYPAVQNFMLAARARDRHRVHDGRADPPRRRCGPARHPRVDGSRCSGADGPPHRKLRRGSPQAGRCGHPLGHVRKQAELSPSSEEGWGMAISNISDLARVHGADRGDKVALRAGDRTITYGELDERTSRVAQCAARRGCRRRRTASRSSTRTAPSTSRSLFGAAKVNAVDVAVNWRLAPPEIAYIVNDARGQGASSSAPTSSPCSTRSRASSTTVKKIVVIGDPTPRHESFDDWIGAPRGRPTRASQAGADDVALQLYTSGTTGLPKGVMLTNDNLFAGAGRADERRGASTPDSVNLVAMPLFHIGGGGLGAASACTTGATTCSCREVDPGAILRADRREHGSPTRSSCRPCCSSCCCVPGVDDADFSSARADRLRRVADHRRRCSSTSMRTLRLRVHPGLRADRDDRRDHGSLARGPRPDGPRRAPAAVRGQAVRVASRSASSTPRPARTRPSARSARSGCARRRT